MDWLRGTLGRAPAGLLQRADGAEPEGELDRADHCGGRLATAQLRGPHRRAVRHARNRLLLLRGGGGFAWPGQPAPQSHDDAGRPGWARGSGRVPRDADALAALGATSDRAAALVGADPLRRGSDVSSSARGSSSRSGCCSSRSRSSSRSCRPSSSAATASSESTPRARAAGALALLVFVTGVTLTLFGLGLVQAATACALVEIDAAARRSQSPPSAPRLHVLGRCSAPSPSRSRPGSR